MNFIPAALAEILSQWPRPRRYVVLVSGGRDSTVLLHALAGQRENLAAPLAVLHFDHGIAADSPRWAAQVREETETLDLPFFRESLAIGPGGALETRARRARYDRLAAWMAPDDCCLTAHHADDQAETFLLQALRGTGPTGLAGMPGIRCFGPGWLGRPLLAWTRGQLAAWAEAHSLRWVEDPGNLDSAAPRNWLRHRIWPLVQNYWPAASITLARSATLAGESAELLAALAKEDLARCGGTTDDRLPIPVLLSFAPARRRNLLHHWLRNRGLPVPAAAKLDELDHGFIRRDPGSRAVLTWAGAEAHRFRSCLHVFAPLPEPPACPPVLGVGRWVNLGILGRIGLVGDPAGTLGPAVAEGHVSLRFRRGGERLRPAGTPHRRTLKNLLQEREILPWMRFRLPLLYVNEDLAAVAGVAIADEFAGTGWTFRWQSAPPIQ